MSVRLLVTGGRDFNDHELLQYALDHVEREHGIEVLIHGDARGADRMAGAWARARKILVQSYPADWKQHGRAAGPIRNQRMLDEGRPSAAVAFPGGNGTADMVRRCERARIPVWDLR